MLEIEPGVLARKASPARVGAPESWGRDLFTCMPAGIQERFIKNQQHKFTLLSIVRWLAPSYMLCIKYLFILIIIL